MSGDTKLATARILSEVLTERERQDTKWGEQNHDPSWWVVIETEELGEVAKAVFEKELDEYRQELIQVAAVAVAAVESLDRQARQKAQEREAMRQIGLDDEFPAYLDYLYHRC